jgi:hypothetical protein
MGFLLCAPLAGLPESGLPAMRGAVASVLLRLPVIKQMLGALGSYPAGARPRRTAGAGLVSTILSQFCNFDLHATTDAVCDTPCWAVAGDPSGRDACRPGACCSGGRVCVHRQTGQQALSVWVGVTYPKPIPDVACGGRGRPGVHAGAAALRQRGAVAGGRRRHLVRRRGPRPSRLASASAELGGCRSLHAACNRTRPVCPAREHARTACVRIARRQSMRPTRRRRPPGRRRLPHTQTLTLAAAAHRRAGARRGGARPCTCAAAWALCAWPSGRAPTWCPFITWAPASCWASGAASAPAGACACAAACSSAPGACRCRGGTPSSRSSARPCQARRAAPPPGRGPPACCPTACPAPRVRRTPALAQPWPERSAPYPAGVLQGASALLSCGRVPARAPLHTASLRRPCRTWPLRAGSPARSRAVRRAERGAGRGDARALRGRAGRALRHAQAPHGPRVGHAHAGGGLSGARGAAPRQAALSGDRD